MILITKISLAGSVSVDQMAVFCCSVLQVKAKYKARAKHFQCKVEMVEQSNVQLTTELATARDALRRYQTSSSSLSSSSSSPASGAAAAGPLPPSPTSLTPAESAVPSDT